MGRSLLKDIDLETLYAMRRDEKLNNQEIADRLGVSRVTVYKLIGPQPKELWKKSGPRTAKSEVKHVSGPVVDDTPPPACLVVEKRTINLCGTFGKYIVDVGDGDIEITNYIGQTIQVPKKQLGDFIDELSAIKRRTEVLKFENEMW